MPAENRIGRKSFYTKVLLYILFFSLIIVAAVSLLYIEFFVTRMNTQYKREHEDTVVRLSSDFDKQVTQMHMLGVFLAHNYDVSDYIACGERDAVTAGKAFRAARMASYLNDNIYSIFLYNRKTDDYILTGQHRINISQFTTAPIVETQSGSKFSMTCAQIAPAPYDSNPSENATPTLSVLFQEEYSAEGFLDSGIIINMDAQVINTDFLSAVSGITMIADPSGKPLFGNSSEGVQLLSEIKDDIDVHLGSDTGNGSFTARLAGNDYFISCTKSNLTGLYTVNMLPLNDLLSATTANIKLAVVISFASLVVALILALIVAKKIYLPVKKIASLFANSRFSRNTVCADELTGIAETFRSTVSFADEMERQQNRNAEIVCQEALRSLMLAYDAGNARLLSDYWRDEAGPCYVLVIQVDGCMKMEPEQRKRCEKAAQDFFAGELREAFPCIGCDMADGKTAVVISPHNTANGYAAILRELPPSMKATMNHIGVSITVSVSGPAEAISAWCGAYAEASELIRYRFLMGPGIIISEQLMKDNCVAGPVELQDINDALVGAVQMLQRDQFLQNLEKLVDQLKKHVLEDAMKAMIETAFVCLNEMDKNSAMSGRRFIREFAPFVSGLYEMEVIDEAVEWLIALYDEYKVSASQLEQDKSGRQFVLVKKGQDYIDRHYQEVALTIEQLSEEVGYSPYYYSKLFKEACGVNIGEAIRQKRIEKAKELLATTDLRVNDIYGKVGYDNYSYFCAIFKKEAGLTPSLYRNNVMQIKKESAQQEESLPEPLNYLAQ